MVDQQSASILDHLQDGLVIVGHNDTVLFANLPAKQPLPDKAITIGQPFTYDIYPHYGSLVRVNDNWVTFAQDNGESTGVGINVKPAQSSPVES